MEANTSRALNFSVVIIQFSIHGSIRSQLVLFSLLPSKVALKLMLQTSIRELHVPISDGTETILTEVHCYLSQSLQRNAGAVVGKVALGQVFSEYFGFPCQSSFHQFIHNHHHLSIGAGTTGQ
jgi:hypothetical protein